VGKTANLSIPVTPQSAGQYWCRASIDNHQDIEAPATVFVRGTLIIYPFHKIKLANNLLLDLSDYNNSIVDFDLKLGQSLKNLR
jgi:hypothetical protein